MLRGRVEQTKGKAVRGASSELRRRRDRRRRRRARVTVLTAQRRRAADAARVEQTLIGAAIDDDVAVELELVQPRPLDEEGALLGVEGLERREVEDGRVGFDLAEVGIHRRIERDVGCDAEFQIGASRHILAAAVARVRQ